MTRKLVLIFAFSATILIILLLGGLVIGKYKYPTLIGLPPLPQDTMQLEKKDTINYEPTYEITKEKLSEFEKRAKEAEAYKEVAKRLESQILELQKLDSIKRSEIIELKDSVLPNKDLVIKESQTFSDYLQDSLSKLISEKEKFKTEAELAKQEKSELEMYIESEVDSLEMENFKQFAKIYNSADPARVAGILETMDERDAAIILKNMRTKNAGKVIEAMNPEKAALIMLLAEAK
jgi:flagellar motility protein MotE (MotC chaperone)